MTHPTFEPQDSSAPQTFPVLEPYDRPVLPADQPVYQPEPVPDAPAPAPVQVRKKTLVVTLSVLLVLFFGTAGAFGVLYFDEKQKSDSLTAVVATKDTELAASAKKVKEGQDEVTKAQNATKQAELAQRRAEDEVGLTAKCRDAARALREAAIGEDYTKATDSVKNLFTVC